MLKTDEIKFHSERALAEIDRARAAASPVVARAHLVLSGLHADRVRELGEAEQTRPALQLVRT